MKTYAVESEFQNGEQEIRVLLPDDYHKDKAYCILYSVHSGSLSSDIYAFKGMPVSELRVVVVANWQRRLSLDTVLKDDV